MRNRYKTYILLWLALFVSGISNAQLDTDYDFESEGLFYKINSDKNTVSVTNGEKKYSGKSIVVPDEVIYNGKTFVVNAISSFAFWESKINSLIIPNSVVLIGGAAFMGSRSLKTIDISNGVTTIGHDAFWGCHGLTTITIPKSVISIGERAFAACSGLASVRVESGNKVYDSRNNCNAIINTNSNALLVGCKNSVIPPNVSSIGREAFYGCSDLTSITIPNSVTSIGDLAFAYCSGLTSITIPNSVTSIGNYAFEYCDALTSVISEIKNPYGISDGVFISKDEKIYSNAILIVPAGIKSAYQSIAGWKNFKNIKEADDNSVTFTKDGISYKLQSGVYAEIITIDKNLIEVKIPSSVSYNGKSYNVSSIAENAFNGCGMGSLIWEPDFAIPNDALNSASIGSNFLLYVKNASYAPSTVKNVVVNGTASAISLSDDGGKFYCPESFKAQKISYSHQYSMKTGGIGKGWETIALPFDVQKISHATRGEMTPFADYSKSSKKKPFWLYSFSGNGFVKSKSILANTPYIISMPNQSDYNSNYILSGEVTFSAENVTVPATPTFSGAFVPSFTSVNKSASVSVLNVVNIYVNETGGYDAGSRFVRNLRDVRPFECYLKGSGSTRSVDEMIEE